MNSTAERTPEQVFGVATYGYAGASARVRLYQWLNRVAPLAETLQYAGTSSNAFADLAANLSSTLRGESEVRALARSKAVTRGTVIVSRQASPFSNGRLITRLLERSAHGVYDFDDALMHDRRRRPWQSHKQWQAGVSAADVVIAGNEFLANAALDLNPRVVVIPSCVEVSDYAKKTSYELGDQGPVAVWIGSPSTEGYLESISGPLLWAHKHYGLRLWIISRDNRSLGELDCMTSRSQWTAKLQRDSLRSADFGIMPLPDNAWTRGKCAYKLLQYGAAGLPLLAAPVGANRRVLELGDGIAVENDGEWRDAISALVSESAQQRLQRGLSAHNAVKSHYSYDVWEPAWRAATNLPAAPD